MCCEDCGRPEGFALKFFNQEWPSVADIYCHNCAKSRVKILKFLGFDISLNNNIIKEFNDNPEGKYKTHEYNWNTGLSIRYFNSLLVT